MKATTQNMDQQLELVEFNGKPAVTSLAVAERFEKQHKNVLRDIDEFQEQCPISVCQLNFEPTSIDVPQPNGGSRTERAYLLSRDGFMLLAMGFTGKKALQVKIAYIEAFNAMEARLQGQHTQKIEQKFDEKLDYSCIPTENNPYKRQVWGQIRPYTPCSPTQLQGVRGLISLWAWVEGLSVEQATSQILTVWRIPSLEILQIRELADIHQLIWKYIFRANDVASVTATEQDWQALNAMLDYGAYANTHSREALQNAVCVVCNVPSLEKLTSIGMKKAHLAAWGIVNRHYIPRNADFVPAERHAK